jgi:hypothetical protein
LKKQENYTHGLMMNYGLLSVKRLR